MSRKVGKSSGAGPSAVLLRHLILCYLFWKFMIYAEFGIGKFWGCSVSCYVSLIKPFLVSLALFEH